jgi:23S rRNA (pseudouridine1915-N3)-methyltransferase
MLDITIIAVGSCKPAFYQTAVDEYRKRLQPFAKVTIKILPDEPFAKPTDQARAKRAEAKRIQTELARHPNSTIFICDERGRRATSTVFAKLLTTTARPIVCVIGGTLGFDKTILDLPHQHISLSDFTLPHALARVILLEQLYRATTIIHNKAYHY